MKDEQKVKPLFILQSSSFILPMAVCFLLHFPCPFGPWALPTPASCGARTFLSPATADQKPAAARAAAVPPAPAPWLLYQGSGGLFERAEPALELAVRSGNSLKLALPCFPNGS